MKIFLYIVGLFVAITLAGWIIQIIFFPVHVVNKEIQMGYDTVDKTLNADNAIYNYEWFKQQEQDINSAKQKLEIARSAITDFEQSAGPRKDWTFEDKTEDARLRAVAQGIESQLKDIIYNYNARLSMANRAIFKDHIIPNPIDAMTFIAK